MHINIIPYLLTAVFSLTTLAGPVKARSQPLHNETTSSVTSIKIHPEFFPGAGYSTPVIPTPTSSDASPGPTYAPNEAVGNVLASNRVVALKKNQEFSKLTANSPCDAADPLQINACVNGTFMRCTDGVYKTILECTAPAKCFALPLETKEGLSVACVSAGDAASKLGVEVS
ncbi:hypothetical protein BZA77DRAFT_269208, partial [Pyronema omphalodes]